MSLTAEERADELVMFGTCDCSPTRHPPHMEGCPAAGITQGRLTRELLVHQFRAAEDDALERAAQVVEVYRPGGVVAAAVRALKSSAREKDTPQEEDPK